MMNPFPKGYTIGAAGAPTDILEDVVEVTEKIDGSQFGFGKIDGELYIRSKGQQIHIGAVNGMFSKAVETVLYIEHLLPDNIMWYGEQLSKPKHNCIKYDRVPLGNIALFGAHDTVNHEFLPYDILVKSAREFGIEVVQVLNYKLEDGKLNLDTLKKLLNTESQLGGTKVEGIYLKKYEPWVDRFGVQHLIKLAKYVSEAFKEVRGKSTKFNSKGKLEDYVETYRTEARWHKAIQHLRDKDELTQSPKDIGKLINEIHADILADSGEEIREVLFKLFWKDFTRKAVAGFPEFYKEYLVKELTNEDTKVDV